MPEKKLHQVIINEIKSVKTNPKFKILDLSCGDAKILTELAKSGITENGVTLFGTRYKNEDYIIKGEEVDSRVNIINDIDLSKPLPFEDESFDIVIMKEVLEHLPNHSLIFYEAGRILKKDGRFFASTPNIHRLHSRLHFLLSGAHKLKRRRIGWELNKETVYAYHYNPLDFTIAHSLLYYAGINITHLPSSEIKPKHLWLLLFYPLIAIITFFEFKKGRPRASQSKESENALRNFMLGKSILLSEQIVICGKKFI
jgi:SAM-dependent methyltransferase